MNLTEVCLALHVSRSGYHDHLRKPRGKRRLQDQLLASALGEEFALRRQTYGSPRLVAALRQRGLRHGKNRVRRLMREQHLHVRQKRLFVSRTTQADRTSPPSPNLLGAQPAPTRPKQARVTDITYLPTGEGWLYVAAEMDLYSRRIIGWDAGAPASPPSCLTAPCSAPWQRDVVTICATCSITATAAANTPATLSVTSSRRGASPRA